MTSRAVGAAAFILGACATVVACERPVADAEVPGLYVMNSGRAADTLWLHRDGHFVRRYIPDAGPEVVVRGITTWWWAEMWPDSASRPPVQRAVLGAPVERASERRPSLTIDDDLGWAYVRVRP